MMTNSSDTDPTAAAATPKFTLNLLRDSNIWIWFPAFFIPVAVFLGIVIVAVLFQKTRHTTKSEAEAMISRGRNSNGSGAANLRHTSETSMSLGTDRQEANNDVKHATGNRKKRQANEDLQRLAESGISDSVFTDDSQGSDVWKLGDHSNQLSGPASYWTTDYNTMTGLTHPLISDSPDDKQTTMSNSPCTLPALYPREPLGDQENEHNFGIAAGR